MRIAVYWSKAVFKQEKPCSYHEIHVLFEHGFGSTSLVNATWRHVFCRNKMTDVEEAQRFSVSFYVVYVIFMRF